MFPSHTLHMLLFKVRRCGKAAKPVLCVYEKCTALLGMGTGQIKVIILMGLLLLYKLKCTRSRLLHGLKDRC